jgi:hypothetical protein
MGSNIIINFFQIQIQIEIFLILIFFLNFGHLFKKIISQSQSQSQY